MATVGVKGLSQVGFDVLSIFLLTIRRIYVMPQYIVSADMQWVCLCLDAVQATGSSHTDEPTVMMSRLASLEELSCRQCEDEEVLWSTLSSDNITFSRITASSSMSYSLVAATRQPSDSTGQCVILAQCDFRWLYLPITIQWCCLFVKA